MLRLVDSTQATTIDQLHAALSQMVGEAPDEHEEEEDADDEDEDESESSASARRARHDNAAAILELLLHLQVAAAPRHTVSLNDIRVKIEAFRSGEGDDSTPGAQVVRLMSIHKAKGLGFHRVYLLQPGSMPLPTTMQWGEEWEKRSEVNAAFVAQTRSYADLIFLRHLTSAPGVSLDFAALWPSADEDRSETEGSGRDDPEDDSQPAAVPVPHDAFRQLGLEPPNADSLSSLRSSSESREDLRDGVKRAYRELILKVHPDKADKDARSQEEAKGQFQVVSEAHETVRRWLSELGRLQQ